MLQIKKNKATRRYERIAAAIGAVLVIVVVERNNNSSHDRCASGATAAVKEPGTMVWMAEYAYAHNQMATVKVAPIAQISSLVTTSSANM